MKLTGEKRDGLASILSSSCNKCGHKISFATSKKVKGTFTPTQSDIGEWWHQTLDNTMIDAGKQEKKLAEERDDYHRGFSCITDSRQGVE